MLAPTSLLGRTSESRFLRATSIGLALVFTTLMLTGFVPPADGLYIFPALICLLLVKPVPLGTSAESMPSQLKRNNIVLGLFITVAASIGIYRLATPPPSDMRTELGEIYRELDSADRTGDGGRAAAALSRSTDLLRKLNDDEPRGAALTRYCALAASHLSTGLAEVSEGRKWSTRDRFKGAYAGCK